MLLLQRKQLLQLPKMPKLQLALLVTTRLLNSLRWVQLNLMFLHTKSQLKDMKLQQRLLLKRLKLSMILLMERKMFLLSKTLKPQPMLKLVKL